MKRDGLRSFVYDSPSNGFIFLHGFLFAGATHKGQAASLAWLALWPTMYCVSKASLQDKNHLPFLMYILQPFKTTATLKIFSCFMIYSTLIMLL